MLHRNLPLYRSQQLLGMAIVLLLHGLAVWALLRVTQKTQHAPLETIIEVRLQQEEAKPVAQPLTQPLAKPQPRPAKTPPIKTRPIKAPASPSIRPAPKVKTVPPPPTKYLVIEVEEGLLDEVALLDDTPPPPHKDSESHPPPPIDDAATAIETPTPSANPVASPSVSPALPPTKITGRVEVGALCEDVLPPNYPEFARKNNVSGTILVRFNVAADGSFVKIVGMNYHGIGDKYREGFLTVIRLTLQNIRCQANLEAATLEKLFTFNLQ